MGASRVSTITAALRRLPGMRALRGSLIAALAVALAAVLGYLSYQTVGSGFKHHHEVLALLRELKEIDSRWDVDILRARSELAPSKVPAVDYGPALSRVQDNLAATAAGIASPVLREGLADLRGAFAQKAGLIEKFRNANGATRQALTRVLATETEMAGLIRGAWPGFADRERLVAAESTIILLLAEAMEYHFSPTATRRDSLETLASDLREAAARLPPAVHDGILRLDTSVQHMLGAKPVVSRTAV